MRRFSRATTSSAAAAAVIAGGLFTAPAQAVPAPLHRSVQAPKTTPVPIRPAAFRNTFRAPVATPSPTPRPLPGAGSGTVTVGAAPLQVGGFTVSLTNTKATQRARTADVRLTRTADGAVTAALTASATQPAWTGALTLRTDQLAPATAADRLRVLDVSKCAKNAGCQAAPVPATHNTHTGTITFTATTASTYTLAAGANGSAGDYSATSLNPASQWGANEQFGAFTWTYPMRVPPAASRVAPGVTLSYDSGSVDGRVAATNNQASWVGEGFDLAPGGYISREFVSCADDMTGGSNATHKTSDLCWGTDNATLVLGGKSSRIVRDTTTGAWRLKEDDGSTLTRLTGAGNGDNDGEYWLLTDTHGTKYYFGLEKRYATDTTTRQSTLTVPVNGNQPGEPCYNATFASGFCDQAWRWNLSYVVDLRGNTITYNYAKESNRYGQNLDTKSVPYDRAGYLTSIEYGQVAGTETATNTQARVLFDVAERCIPSGTITCDPTQLTAANAAYWPDVPQDQICTSTTTCGTGHYAPAFFSRKRLTAVHTQVLKAGAFADVERWDLTQSFPSPGDGTPASLQLDQVQHTGLVGGTAATPPVLFSRIQLANRVDAGTYDGDATLIKYRVSSIKTEAGGVISVNYLGADCATGSLPTSPDTNTRRCFPNYWTPPGATAPVLGWFHKYVLDSVVADGAVAPSQATVTRYTYVGAPAWHYDDNITQPAKYRTWSQFRGFPTVDTITGDTNEANPLRTRATFYRGMNGDKLAAGGTKTAVVTDSTGATTPDDDWFNGLVRESITYNSTSEVNGQISTPWAGPVTATDAYGSARIVRAGAVVNARQSRTGTTPFTTQTTTTFDTTGNPTQVSDAGDTTRTDDDRCTTNTFVSNTSLNIIGLPSSSKTVDVACGATVGATDTTSETQTYYDGATVLTTSPTKGEPTMTMARADSGMVTTSTTTYDAVGRATRVTDALGHATTTAYTPADNQATTAVAVTDAKGFTTTTTLDPGFGVPTKSVDANTRTTTITLDPLGRTSKVWAPNRATYQSPSYQYTYVLTQSGASSVTSSSLHYLGTNRVITTQLYDGLLRPVQTQTQSGSANRVLTDTIYDTRGLATSNRGPWFSTGLPATTAVTAADASIDKIVTTAYDGAARPTRATTWVLGTEQFHTDSVYNGDSTDMLPPAGAVATRSVVDARGRQTQLWQYHGSTVTTAKDVTSYTYNNKDQLTKVANQAGISWTYGYNQLGQQTSAVDPDKGTTTTVFDLLGNVLKTTDAASRILNRTYDELNRPLSVTDGTGAAQSQWTYDTVTAGKGQLASSTSYSGGAAYTDTVNSYDALYDVTGNTITVPATETGLAGSYAYTRSYNPDGSFGYVNMPAVANLSAEQLAYQRDATNLPTNALGSSSIVAGSSRDGFGRLTQYTLQTLDVATTVTQSYQTGLDRLASYRVDRANVATPDENATFTYDPAGNITSIADVPDPATPARTDQQCFAYTWDRELSDAWANGSTSCSPTPSLVASGAAPYWTSWTYDAAHRRATQTQHGATTSTTDTYAYPAITAPHPNGASSVTAQVGTGTPTTANLGYDATGNTTSSPLPGGGTGSFTWDAQSRLATVTKVGVTGSSANVYSADGSLLVRRDPSGSKTLFLDGDTQITYTPANGSVPASTTALRIFTFEGQVVAYRKADGYAGVVFQPPGYQGTSLVQTQGSGSATGVAVRRLTPFGAPRGTTAGTWELGRGFLGGTSPTAVTDPGTGLVHLGAREYDPALGRFLSVDPLMDLNDPTQFNAYGYSDNNPITMSDPAGTRPLGRSDTDAVDMVTTGGNVRPGYTSSPVQSTIEDSNQRATAGMTPHERKEYQAEEQPRVEQEVVHAEKAAYWELESRSQAVAAHRALAIVNVVVPYQDTIDCFQGQGVGSCASAAMVVLPVKGGGAAVKFGLKTFLETGGRPAVRGVEAAAKGGAAAVRMGQAGEAAVRSMYDIGPKATRVIAGRTRIFDGLTTEAVSEVKNVAYQAYTQQLKDSLAYAQQEGLRFDLYVRGGANPTILSKPLRDAIAGTPNFNLEYIP